MSANHRVFFRSLSAALAAACGLATAPDAAAQALECGEALCVAINNAPARAPSGSLVTFDINYRYQAGDYPEGIEIYVDAPRYFVANSVPTNDIWQPYLLPSTGPQVASVCQRLESNPWHVECGVARSPFVVSDNVNNGLITVAMWSQPFDTPQDYPATFTVTISGKRRFPIDGGPLVDVTHSATAVVGMYGEANPYLSPANIYPQYDFPADTPDLASQRAHSEGLNVPHFTGYVWVANLDDPEGPPVRVRQFTLAQTLSNTVPRPTLRNSSDFDAGVPYAPESGVLPGSGDQYTPNLVDDEHFEVDAFRPVAGSPGSNALLDVRYEIRLPSWVRYGGASGPIAPGAAGTAAQSFPSYGAHGGLVASTLTGPFGRSNPITAALYPTVTSALATTTLMGVPTVTFYIPCDVDLTTLDTDRARAGTQLPEGMPLFELSVSGNERRSVPDPMNPGTWQVTNVLHASSPAPYNALSGVTLVDCPAPGLPGVQNNSKAVAALPHGSSHLGSGNAAQWSLNFYPLLNVNEGYGDFAVVEAIPPFFEAGRFSNWTGATTSHPSAGAPWLCVLPRTPILPPPFTGTCPDVTTTVHSPSQPKPWNPSSINCQVGAPYGFVYDPVGLFLDPMESDMEVPFELDDPAGLGWNEALQMGCLRVAEVCDHATARRSYGTCQPGQDGKRLYAHEVTHVIWRSDQPDTEATVGWPATQTALGLPAPPSALNLYFQTWSTPIDDPSLPYPLPNYEDRRVAWSINSGRFFGGSFDIDGAGPIPVQSLGDGTLTLPNTAPGSTIQRTYNTTVYAGARIDNRWSMSTTFTTPSTTVNRGASMSLGTVASVVPNSVNSPPPPLVGGVTAFIDLPPGMNPGWAVPTTANLRRITLVVPDNPTGLSGTLTDSVSFDPTRFTALVPPTEADLNATLEWVGSPTDPNQGHWRYRFAFDPSFLSLGWTSWGVYVTASPRDGYPFVNLAPNVATITVTAPGFDRNTDDNPLTYSTGDPEDYVRASTNILVPMLAEVKIESEPTCVPGRTAPAFLVRYHNVGGVDQYGTEAVFQVPEAVGDVPVVFAGVFEEPAWRPPGTTPTLEVSTTTRDPFQLAMPITWTELSAYAGPLADIKLVRVRFGDTIAAANRLPAWFANGRFRVDLATPGVTLGDIGTGFTSTTFIGTRLNGNEVLPLASSLPSRPFLLGQCPARLQVEKFYDHDQDGTRNGPDHALSAWPFELTRVAGQSLATGDHVDNTSRSGLTDEDGRLVFEVWPGQVPTLVEALPEPSTVPVPDYPGTTADLTWSATTPGATTRALAMLGFDDFVAVEFGNACTCTSDNRCIHTTCVPPTSGEEPATCAFDYTGPSACTTPGQCSEASGYCDPATGQCAYPEIQCEGQATRIYVVIEDTEGQPIGTVVCELDDDSQTLTCATREEGGSLVLDVQEVLLCGP